MKGVSPFKAISQTSTILANYSDHTPPVRNQQSSQTHQILHHQIMPNYQGSNLQKCESRSDTVVEENKSRSSKNYHEQELGGTVAGAAGAAYDQTEELLISNEFKVDVRNLTNMID